jgi:dTDP-glucose 4,6-dehydratase
MTVLEFAQVVNQLTGNPAGIVYRKQDRIEGDPQTRRPDITRARKLLGWEPRVDLQEGLQRTTAYFESRVRV